MTTQEQDWMPIALAVIKHFEASDKCHTDSYIVEGEEHMQATIGWGHAIPLSKHPMKITLLIADRWMMDDIKVRFKHFEMVIPQKVRDKMTAAQIAAFISWAYNGVDSLWHCDSLKKLIAGDIHGWIDGADEWDNHDLAGLVRRRAVERHLVERGEIERIKSNGKQGLDWYRGLIYPVNQAKNKGKTGHLAWQGDRLIWKVV